jgi:hypothetical protein
LDDFKGPEWISRWREEGDERESTPTQQSILFYKNNLRRIKHGKRRAG